MHSFEVHSNESACRKSGRLGLEKVTSCSTSSDSNQINNQKVSIFCIDDNNTQKTMTYNDTRLTVAISDIIISEGLYLNLDQKPLFKKVLYMKRNVSIGYQHPNIKLI